MCVLLSNVLSMHSCFPVHAAYWRSSYGSSFLLAARWSLMADACTFRSSLLTPCEVLNAAGMPADMNYVHNHAGKFLALQSVHCYYTAMHEREAGLLGRLTTQRTSFKRKQFDQTD